MSNTVKNSMQEVKRHSCAEIGTAVFAFLNVLLASICLLICMNILFLYIWEYWSETDKIDTFMWSMCLSINFLVIVVFVFAILLFIGINRKKPSYVLAYFIFGVIVVISIVCGLPALRYVYLNVDMNKAIRHLFDDYYESITHIAIGVCVAYILLLTMICRTWFLMTSRRPQGHVKLVEDYYESESDRRVDLQ